MRVSLIVAAAGNGVIGRGGDIPWHLPDDLRRFKALTMGHHLIVGRKTWESIGRPLPGREMLIVSRSNPELPPGVRSCASLDEALEIARAALAEEVFVAGGGEIYRLALPQADRVYYTRVDARPEGDATFPELPHGEWRLASVEGGRPGDGEVPPHAFLVYDRFPPPETLP